MCSKATEDFKQKCKTLYDKADKNGDGLSIHEFATIIREVSKGEIPDRKICDLFVQLDTDGDRIVSWDEFCDCLKRDPKTVEASELKAVFVEMDKDGSGKLNASEIKAQFTKLKIKVSEEDLNKILAESDKNGDGSIDYDEFLKAWGDK